MNVIFCTPRLTMKRLDRATEFYKECKENLDLYIFNVNYISTENQVHQILTKEADKDDIFIFFCSEEGEYSDLIMSLIRKYNDVQSRIWAIAMEGTPECRKPPEPVSDKQSFDISSRMENRNPLKNNVKAIAQLFARKIISQVLSPLYQDEVLYFISHKRDDGEQIAAKLADGLRNLTRERNVYRDVVNVRVGENAQEDIDKHLAVSDAVIFLQTKEAQNSKYIMKEICYALVNNIPVLWIQIDNAPYDNLEIRPGQNPILKYYSNEFNSSDRLEEIVDEVEDKCFELIMNMSCGAYSYINCLMDMSNTGKIQLTSDNYSALAYEIKYHEDVRDLYDSGNRKHYIQCYGRNPKSEDIEGFTNRVKKENIYNKYDKLFLLSNHGSRSRYDMESKVIEDNYDDYLMNLEKISGFKTEKRNKRIILSGAFPDYDEIYKASLLEALVVYSKEIIKNGYTLVFGAHPTFQKLIFDIGRLYSLDVKYSIEMHMDKAYINQYNINDLNEKCTLILADNIQQMRQNMICQKKAEMMICMGGKIKDEKLQQGVDIEIELAKQAEIPVALVGTVGGRSSEYAYEKIEQGSWGDLNPWDKKINESLFYNMNHRLMIKRLLNLL